MRAAIDGGSNIELKVLGDDSVALRRWVQPLGLEGRVQMHAAIPHGHAVRAMQEADVLVVYQSPGRNDVTPVAGKTYEYLRTGLPILAIVPAGDNADLVRRHAPVHAVVMDEDPMRVAEAIQDLIRRGASIANPVPDPELIVGYARRSIAERIAAIFDSARNGHTS